MVSIVIPTYNRPHMLSNILGSIAEQTFKKYEVIIVDDHSPQIVEYQEIIQKFQKKISELTFLRNTQNHGAPYSRNKGIASAKYNFIALVDDDDLWLPDKLQKQFDLFQNSPSEVGIVYTWAEAKSSNGKTTHQYRATVEGGKMAQQMILREDFIPSPTVMVRKQAIQDAGLFDVNFISCQDWDMWTRILFSGYECRVVKSVEAIYLKHSEETIGKSANALKGYAQFYRKHIKKTFLYNPILSLKYAYRFFKISIKGLF